MKSIINWFEKKPLKLKPKVAFKKKVKNPPVFKPSVFKILTRKSCIVSAKLLRDALEKETGKNILVTTDSDKIRGNFLRYGNSDPVNINDTELNPSSFIEKVSDKKRFSEIMKENDIYSPVYHSDGEPKKYPVLIRKTLTGQGGAVIVLCKDKNEFLKNWKVGYFWTDFIDTSFELRVHILDGKIVKVFKKVFNGKPNNNLNEEELEKLEKVPEPEYPIRNLEKGYHYSNRDILKYAKLQPFAEKIHKALVNGLFYTLDIGWDSVKKSYFIFEVNSGSGLNSSTVELYSSFLSKKIQ